MNNKFKKTLSDMTKPFTDVMKNVDKLKTSSEGFKITQQKMPDIPINPNLTSEFSRRLVSWITEFETSLDKEHEVGVRLVSFGQTVTFNLEKVHYWSPSLILFSGTTDSEDLVELIQHVSQISILLMKCKRKDPSKAKQKIGFL